MIVTAGEDTHHPLNPYRQREECTNRNLTTQVIQARLEEWRSREERLGSELLGLSGYTGTPGALSRGSAYSSLHQRRRLLLSVPVWIPHRSRSLELGKSGEKWVSSETLRIQICFSEVRFSFPVGLANNTGQFWSSQTYENSDHFHSIDKETQVLISKPDLWNPSSYP